MGEPVPAQIAAAAGAPQVEFTIVEGGMTRLRKGDISVTRPDGPVGVVAENMPPGFREKLSAAPKATRMLIFDYRSENADSGLVHADVKLICEIQYNGPEVRAIFDLPADGMRSQLGTRTTIEIQNPLWLERIPAPDTWRTVGFRVLPVVYIPVSIRVDEPWPSDTYRASFNLVLSGLYGFGKSLDGYCLDSYHEAYDSPPQTASR